ncbi:hypothetical protein [Staphylococcus phage vB_SauH_DELF3]|nr:hypothetical protein [Staphylococcus phage vB_SauH_DELF3]
MSEFTKFYEQDIQELITTERHRVKDDEISCNIQDIRIFNENAICQGKCRTDCLILNNDGTVMHIEIKKEPDSTTRLNKHVRMYSLFCKYVYVVCHDHSIDKVEIVIKRCLPNHVGNISYISFEGEPINGKYKQAMPSPIRSPYHPLNMIWKQHLMKRIKQLRDYNTYLTGYNYREAGKNNTNEGSYTEGLQRERMKKSAIKNQVIHYLGAQTYYSIFTRGVRYGYSNRWHVLEDDFFKVIQNGVSLLYGITET